MKLSTLSFIFIVAFLMTSCGQKKTNTTESTETKTEEVEKDMVESTTESTTQEESTTEEATTDSNVSTNMLGVFLNDPDKSGTNIRKSPNGEVLMKIVPKGEEDYFSFTLSEAKEGWFKIEAIDGMDTGNVEIKGSEGWIHGSVIAIGTRNYGGQTLELLDAPKTGKVVAKIKKEEYALKLKDMSEDWVKVEYNGVSGWINREWLCGNPVTNCN